MLFNVPQFIDVEDKVAGPLTAKQIFWMLGMGAFLFLVWTIFDQATFFTLSIPIILIFALFAFYRPYNQPFLTFITNAVFFLFRPKLYVWNRPGLSAKPTNTPVEQKNTVVEEPKKRLTLEEIQELARTVDTK